MHLCSSYTIYWYVFEDANSLTASIIWDAYMGFGDNGVGEDSYIIDGLFANHTLNISPVINNTLYCLSRDFNADRFVEVNYTYIDQCFATTNHSVAWDCWARQSHDLAHDGVGGTIEDAILSPGGNVALGYSIKLILTAMQTAFFSSSCEP
ncbi:putative amino acid transporter [Diplodia seriata]|uniref:Putative amino acid transporter n=1 Tax=Diplodia seriata TaxID=420778 RepID=A0A0G2EYL3_9PEZI|nr:putative amino acid transporter [Diplodia seriata]